MKRIKSRFKRLSFPTKGSRGSRSVNINHKICCDPNDNKPWCKECVPGYIIDGWTSENTEIDEFIKNTIYNSEYNYYNDGKFCPLFLEWVPFDRFEDIKQIGEGGFAKVYSATWIDGKASLVKQDDGSWKKKDPEPMKVALKKLNESQNMSAEYLNGFKAHWNAYNKYVYSLKFYGITRDPETKEFMMITELAEQGDLRSFLSSDFNKILWKDKILLLYKLIIDLRYLHNLGYFHKNFHSGNILQIDTYYYISDFGLSGQLNKRADNKIYGVLPYIAPEVLNGDTYTSSSDIYSFGIIMTELSSGQPPFNKSKHDTKLALEICDGLRPEFGKGTPEIYKKLAYRCMNANPDQRPTADELYEILGFWYKSTNTIKPYHHECQEIRTIFQEADDEIPNISTSFEKNPDAIYTSRELTISNLSKPVNSSITTSYLNDEVNKVNINEGRKKFFNVFSRFF